MVSFRTSKGAYQLTGEFHDQKRYVSSEQGVSGLGEACTSSLGCVRTSRGVYQLPGVCQDQQRYVSAPWVCQDQQRCVSAPWVCQDQQRCVSAPWVCQDQQRYVSAPWGVLQQAEICISSLHRKKRFASFPSPAGMSLPNNPPGVGIMTS